MNNSVCHNCSTPFEMGVNGIVDDRERPTCDNCAGVTRDANGYAISPAMRVLGAVYQDVATGKKTYVPPWKLK